MADVHKLIEVLQTLVDAGIRCWSSSTTWTSSRWPTNHRPGPRGGSGGGTLVAQGTPEKWPPTPELHRPVSEANAVSASQRLPLRGAGAERLTRCYRTKGLPQGFRPVQRALTRRRPLGGTPLRHASRATSPQRRGFGVRRLRKKLPLRGAVSRRQTERCLPAPMASRRVPPCAEGADAPPPVGRHTSPSRFACHLPSRGGLWAGRLRKKLPSRGGFGPRRPVSRTSTLFQTQNTGS